MRRRLTPLPLMLLAAALLAPPPAQAADEPKLLPIAELKRDKAVDFDAEVLPILKKSCLACHNATTHEGGLVLETPQAMLKGGDNGPAIAPKQGADSMLIVRARGGGDGIMPPEDNKAAAKPLSPQELGLLKLWIDQGAPGSAKKTPEAVKWQPLPPGVNPILAVALTPDGQYAVCGRANQIFVYHLPTGRFVGKLTDPELLKAGVYKQPGVADLDLIQSLAISPDGLTLASGGYRTVKLWRRPRNVQLVKLADGAAEAAQALATSADGKWLATAAGQAIRLVDLSTGKPAATLAGHEGPVTALKFSADGKLLASGSQDKSVRTWSVPEGKPLIRIDTPAAVTAVALVGDKQLATAGGDAKILLWDIPAEQPAADAPPLKPAKELTGHSKLVTSLDTLPTNRAQIISGSEDGLLIHWDAAAGKQIRQMKHGGAITAVAARPDGQRFASAGTDKVARLWNAGDGKALADMKGDLRARHQVAALERELTNAKNNVAGEKAAVAEAEKNLTAENEAVKKATEAQAAAAKTLGEKAAAAKKAADEKAAADKAAAEANDAAKQAADAKTAADKALADADAAAKDAKKKADDAKAEANKPENKEKKEAAEAKDAAEKAAAEANKKLDDAKKAKADADKAAAAAADKAKQAAAAAMQKEKPAADAEKARMDAETAKVSADKALAAANVAAKKATDRVPQAKQAVAKAEQAQKDVEAALEAAKKAAEATETPLRSVAFSSDNLQLATGGDDKIVHTWNADTGAAIEAFDGHAGVVGAVAFAGDRRLVSAAADKSAVVWDTLPEWTWVRTLGSGSGAELVDRVTALDFSPDGQLLASGGGSPSRSGELKLWRVTDGALVRDLADAHSDTVLGLEFSPDGKHLASCAADKFVKVFEVSTGKFVRAFEGHTHHVLGVAWQSDGKVLASCGADNVVKVWDFVTGDQKRTIQGFGKEVTSINFIGDTPNLLASSGDKSVKIHRASDGGNVRTFGGASDFVYASAVTPDGKIVLAGGQDSVLRAWQGDNGQVLREFAPPPPPAASEQARK